MFFQPLEAGVFGREVVLDIDSCRFFFFVDKHVRGAERKESPCDPVPFGEIRPAEPFDDHVHLFRLHDVVAERAVVDHDAGYRFRRSDGKGRRKDGAAAADSGNEQNQILFHTRKD